MTSEERKEDPTEDGGDDAMKVARRDRRLSRASVKFFDLETSIRNLSISSTSEGGLIDSEGKVRDEYILQRQSVNRPTTLNKVPLLCDLTTSSNITNVDGWVFSMLLVSGFAKMSSKINELNAINVFPIADGDTGANMKVCLKLPIRNLLLKPNDNIMIASREMAADVLLNGQGNSGTILSHFFVELAEAVRGVKKSDMSVDEFASCLIRAGVAMDDAVPNPVNGTLLSVCRDALVGLEKQRPYATLDVLLSEIHKNCQSELAKTPDQLIVDGVKVLEKAGVVDSGAQGFAYLAEGMYLASIGELPNALDPQMFRTATLTTAADSPPISVDHSVCESQYRYCTEAVVLLKEGVTPNTVFDRVQKAASEEGIGDSAVFVKGFDMVKIHLHTNDPDQLFDILQPFNRDPILKKEKVEDMLDMRENMHGEDTLDLGDAKFSIMGLCSYILPNTYDLDELYTIPLFAVPSTTLEPIDMRFVTDEDVCVILNQQRHKETAIKYTTAASNPMQLKIEILAALAKGKPLLLVLFSTDKRMSAMGRNAMLAIDMLDDEQKKLVKVYTHGWTFYEQPFLTEAIKYAEGGKSIDEAIEACQEIGDHCLSFSSFVTSSSVRKLLAWRPGLFPEGFTVEDNSFTAFGLPVTYRDVVLTHAERFGKLMVVQNQAMSMADLQDAEIARVKANLKSDEKLSKVIVQTTGRIDIGHKYIQKMKDANVPMMEDVEILVNNAGLFAAVVSAWGEMSAVYVVKKV
jgi:dihydroxyacetone kinase-like predicted kinase